MISSFHIPSISCEHCRRRIENTLKSVDSVENYEFDLSKGIVVIKTELDPYIIISLIGDFGYDAALI